MNHLVCLIYDQMLNVRMSTHFESLWKQENRIKLGQNPGRRTKPKKVDGEGAKMRSDIELFEARLAQVSFNLNQFQFRWSKNSVIEIRTSA